LVRGGAIRVATSDDIRDHLSPQIHQDR
jgi:hypothetical protein